MIWLCTPGCSYSANYSRVVQDLHPIAGQSYPAKHAKRLAFVICKISPKETMNAPQTGTVVAWANRSLGWAAELLGRASASPELASMGRNRQLRASVTLHCAKVKGDANKAMRSWKLPDTRLLNVHAAEDNR